MQDVASVRSINMGQLVTATDRLLAFGRPHKLDIERDRTRLVRPSAERTVIVRPSRARYPFAPAVVLAAMFGVASLIAIGVGTTHTTTFTTTQQP